MPGCCGVVGKDAWHAASSLALTPVPLPQVKFLPTEEEATKKKFYQAKKMEWWPARRVSDKREQAWLETLGFGERAVDELDKHCLCMLFDDKASLVTVQDDAKHVRPFDQGCKKAPRKQKQKKIKGGRNGAFTIKPAKTKKVKPRVWAEDQITATLKRSEVRRVQHGKAPSQLRCTPFASNCS